MTEFDPVESWIDSVAYSHSESKSTEDVYKRSLERFCQFIGKTPKQILEEYEKTDDKHFRRKYAQYLKALISKRKREGYAVNSIRNEVQAVRSFFKYSDLPLAHVPLGRKRITFHNRDIKRNEIIKLLEISRPRDKAFFCMMAQTGLRPRTLCELKLRHLEPDFSRGTIPCKIEIPQEIAKGQYRSYFTFMGEESVKYLKAYLSKRVGVSPDDYLFTAHGTDKKANPHSLSRIFRENVDKLKETKQINFKDRQFSKPAELRMYNLRKFFRKMSHQAGFEIVQFWMGHIVESGVEEHYRPQDVEWHRQLYREKAMPNLRLETATPSETEQVIKELREEIASRDKTLNETQQRLDQLFQLTVDLANLIGLQNMPEDENDEFFKESKRIRDLIQQYNKRWSKRGKTGS